MRTICMMTSVMLLTAAPASAANEIAVSLDGSSWGSSLSQPLFDPNFLWVPGDDETSSFYVRNDGPSGARMRVDVQSTDPNNLVADDDILVWARVDGGAWTRLADGVAPTALTERIVGEGGVTRVDLRVVFDPASVNQSQVKSVRLGFVITLSQAVTGDDSDDGRDDDSGDDSDDGDRNGLLPGTGSDADAAWLFLAAAMIGGGAGVWGRSRDRESAGV